MKCRKYLLVILLSPITVLFQIAPAVAGGIIIAGTSALTSIIGGMKAGKSQKMSESAAAAQQEATEFGYAEKIRTYEYNIEQIGEGAKNLIGDIKRESATFQRKQMAAMGAAGAEVGSGTPLMNMLATEAVIAGYLSETARAADKQIEFMKGEIEEYEEELMKTTGGQVQLRKRKTPKGTGYEGELGKSPWLR